MPVSCHDTQKTDLAMFGDTQLPIDFPRCKGREAKWNQPV
jgi:hypothetical protein